MGDTGSFASLGHSLSNINIHSDSFAPTKLTGLLHQNFPKNKWFPLRKAALSLDLVHRASLCGMQETILCISGDMRGSTASRKAELLNLGG